MECGCYILFLKDFCLLFFKTAGKDVTLRHDEMVIWVRANEKDLKKKNLKPKEPEKGMKRALALIAYEDILDGGGVYNN